MKLEQVEIPITNPLLKDYTEEKSSILPFFHYANRDDSFSKRLEDIQNHPVRRQQLAAIVRDYMKPFGVSEKAEEHLKELEDQAVVVIGGQQAGLLTGPMYSVHKALSVILLAKEQRRKLGLPVVPVFWIAGEDHDIDEINHTFTAINGRLEKHIYRSNSKKKLMASTTVLDTEEVRSFIQETFKQYGETAYTEKLLKQIDQFLVESKTYTDFFTALMNWLFKEEGLLFVDAADPKLRAYESPYFEKLIKHTEQIADVVTQREADFAELGYGTPIGATKDAANLFYVRDGERFLLEHHNGKFINHIANVQFSKNDMLEIANEHPEQLSNNVVTRPLMQDMVFPVLAFIGGPGELAYWATLKDAFALLDMKVPVFVPRLNVSIIDRQVQHVLGELDLSVADALAGKATLLKGAYEADVYDVSAKEMIDQTMDLLREQYDGLLEHMRKNDIQLEKLAEKNLSIHQQQLDFLNKKIEREILLQHDVELRRYRLVEDRLLPGGGLQERTFNPFLFMNEYGESFIQDLMGLPFSFNSKHKAVFL
ncbi:bacillithiol biosynthesis cysteine-adding enzyme BshC [Rummeliibacillus sp. G93]|uniref:bacillithiol biosynthesis cysteine-adding enzyme BshC n=1 Tax=Rummeliibacillus TaxID=648802 RepID=UPI00116C3B16|nr:MULTISPECIES: bacillithiol biosynthesis cysteine-adding enzyme BshC [Rummeliibacillus]MBB5169975.1 bacillithiol biosynthesis cysteine-adding enzyme BshC [Rummeliibacillus stabekisii]UQW98293.1 bacillithiol biosynthesis cysteine-adding enzyme BshC [Rummeliibacillus sp. G93]GEL04233.1 putative cysteine ligase BshC [Rummeliibacillus stabekisii]